MKIKAKQQSLDEDWGYGYFYTHTLGEYAQTAKDALSIEIHNFQQNPPPEPIKPPIPEGYPPLKKPVKPTPPKTYQQYLDTIYVDEAAQSETEYDYTALAGQYNNEYDRYTSDLAKFNTYQNSELAKQHVKYEHENEQYKKDYKLFNHEQFTIQEKSKKLASLNEPISYQQVILEPGDIDENTGKLTPQAQKDLTMGYLQMQ